MKIPAKDIDKFISNVPKNIKAILLYGPDHGLVKIRADFLQEKRSSSGKFLYEQLKSDASIILDSLNSLSLFNNNLDLEKFLLIEFNGALLAEPLLNILKIANFHGLIICTAGELGPDSSLRRFFENNPHVAAIPCYKDDSVGISKIIQQIFAKQRITYEANLIPILLDHIAIGDRSLIVNEIEKILLFLGEKKHITLADIDHCLTKQGEVSFEKLNFQISLKSINELEFYLDRLLDEGHSNVSIVRMITHHFYRLYQVKSLIDLGKSETQALDMLTPPVFFKQIPEFNRSLSLWNKEQLAKMLKQLTELELEIKRNANMANLNFRRFLLSVFREG